jgi:glycosyltransferase involved in cell wall biosynthesis
MVIINIVDSLDKINYGIWNAALSTADYLYDEYNIRSEVWHPRSKDFTQKDLYKTVIFRQVKNGQENELFKQYKPKNAIIVTHGAWRFPTRWGAEAQKKGFKWVYTPHGMLEPWSRKKKWFKKWLYYQLLEKKLASQAKCIRAVGTPELQNLKKDFSQLTLIPNGILVPTNIEEKKKEVVSFLFLGRLHHKKQLKELVLAWSSSNLKNIKKAELIIAGPDQGESRFIEEVIKKENIENIFIPGAIYGGDKIQILKKSHYFLLPSQSEGFPTSVVEGAGYGAIPIISEGCNFPEIFEKNIAYNSGIETSTIKASLEKAFEEFDKNFAKMSSDCHEFIKKSYDIKVIAGNQYKLYCELLKE